MTPRAVGYAAALCLLLLAPGVTSAQMRASERALTRQTVDGTVITLDYSRPVARGRSDLFGKVVKWGQVWTPGANDATVLELSRDVRIDGHQVPAGRWSVWIALAEDAPWELVLDPRDTLFHTQEPRPTSEQIRFPVRREEGEHVEVLTWSFPAVTPNATTLRMAWGTTHVSMVVTVEPSYTIAVPPEQAARYVGRWESAAPTRRLDIRAGEDGTLAALASDGEEFLLVPSQDGLFLMQNREFLSFGGESFLKFEMRNRVPVAASIRSEKDVVYARGTRVRDATAPGSGRTAARGYTGVWEMVSLPLTTEILHREDGALLARTVYPTPAGPQNWDELLVPVAEGVFRPGHLQQGELFDIETDVYWEFDFEGDRPVRFAIRWGPKDKVFALGRRLEAAGSGRRR
jgi:hypothetical protein